MKADMIEADVCRREAKAMAFKVIIVALRK